MTPEVLPDRVSWIGKAHTGGAPRNFQTIQAWLDSFGVPLTANDANADMVGIVSPAEGGYTESPAVPGYRNILLLGYGQQNFQVTGSLTWNNSNPGGGAVAPSTARLTLHDVGFTSDLTITDDGTVTEILYCIGNLRVDPFILSGNIIATGATKLSSVHISGCRVGNITSTADANGATVFYGKNARIGSIVAKAIGGTVDTFSIGPCLFSGTAYTVAAANPAFFYQSRFSGANPIVSGGSKATFDGPSYMSFLEKGGTVTSPMKTLVIGGYAGAPVLGAALTDADVTVSLDGGGASVGFTDGGNYYRLTAALTANRTLTLGTSAALKGDVICIVRSSLSVFTYAIANGGGGGGTIFTFPIATSGTFKARFDGTNWTALEEP